MKLITLISTLTLLAPLTTFAQGTGVGGGGDTLEMRVNEIRADLSSWIEGGGADALSFKDTATNLSEYKFKMQEILKPHRVLVQFTENPVMVQGVEKVCRGSLAKDIYRIKCNATRFPKDETEQYRLVHHEFAGLVRAELNQGASSDYALSDQITKSLRKTTVLRLAVKPSMEVKLENLCATRNIQIAPFNRLGYGMFYSSLRCLVGYYDLKGNFFVKSITDQLMSTTPINNLGGTNKTYTELENNLKAVGNVASYAPMLDADEFTEMCQGFGFKNGVLSWKNNQVINYLSNIEEFKKIKDQFIDPHTTWYQKADGSLVPTSALICLK